MPWEVRAKDDEYCVYKIGGDSPIKGGCHKNRGDAVKHVRALYANEPTTMKYSVLSFSDDVLTDTEDPNVKWVKAWRYSSWDHPKYGKVEITPQTGNDFKSHFDSKNLGRDHLVNYDHGGDPAKGGKAAGAILEIDPRDDGIYYKCHFTDTALEEIAAGEWRYLSPEYDDYIDRESGDVFENMPFDLALTNKPFFKGMPPLNFSELYEFNEGESNKPKGGNAVDDLLKQFADRLGINLEDDMSEESILKAADNLNETIEPLRKTKREGETNRTFREAFPDQWEKIQRLEAQAIDTEAREFSDSYTRFTIKNDSGEEFKSVYGFSTAVKDKIVEVHKKFSHREANHKDLKDLLDQIGNQGIVDYSEHGSSRTGESREFSEEPRLAFSEAVQDVMEKDGVSYEAAIGIAAKKHPKLYESYLAAIPQR